MLREPVALICMILIYHLQYATISFTCNWYPAIYITWRVFEEHFWPLITWSTNDYDIGSCWYCTPSILSCCVLDFLNKLHMMDVLVCRFWISSFHSAHSFFSVKIQHFKLTNCLCDKLGSNSHLTITLTYSKLPTELARYVIRVSFTTHMRKSINMATQKSWLDPGAVLSPMQRDEKSMY